jgi:hypothetical protein
VLLAACGSSPSAPSAATTTGGVSAVDERPPPPAQAGHRDEAALGRLLRAHAVARSSTRRSMSRAAPARQTMYTQASCSRSSCRRDWRPATPTVAGPRSLVVAPIDAPQLSITVSYADPASGQTR